LSETYIWAVLFQLTAALFYCHTGSLVDVKGNFTLPMEEWNPIFHRDIKPANGKQEGTIRSRLKTDSEEQ
jgi:serine/threonine protein kinase